MVTLTMSLTIYGDLISVDLSGDCDAPAARRGEQEMAADWQLAPSKAVCWECVLERRPRGINGTRNPLSPPCIPPNSGFHDLPAKRKFRAVAVGQGAHLRSQKRRLRG